MKNFKKNLSIEVEENTLNEEDLQNLSIQTTIDKRNCVHNLRRSEDSSNSLINSTKIMGESYNFLQNYLFKEILKYMEQENKDSDLSYKWYFNFI